jgi:hypothetical protein
MNNPTYDPKYKSYCHNAPVYVVSDSFGEGTNHYECDTCKQSCNFVPVEPTSNPGESQDTANPGDELDKLLEKVHFVGCPHCPDYNKGRQNAYCTTKVEELEAALRSLIEERVAEALQNVKEFIDDNSDEVRIGNDTAWVPIVNAEDMMSFVEERLAVLTPPTKHDHRPAHLCLIDHTVPNLDDALTQPTTQAEEEKQ